MEKKRLDELSAIGEKADELLIRGRAPEALKRLEELAHTLESTGEIDSYLAAKITLSVLRCHLKIGKFKEAFTVWNADIEESIYGVGILALESAQTTVKDMVTYDMICAFLHTMADGSSKDAGEAVNQYLSRVCEQALEEGDRLTMKLALNSWKHHLKAIFKTSIPHDMAKPLIHFERMYGETVKPQPIDFPLPSAWEKPNDFREMSRVAEKIETAQKRPHAKHGKKSQAS